MKPKRRIPPIIPVTLALLLFGAVKLPIEQSLDDAHRASFFRGAKLTLGLREQIGQGAFLAALSGYRSLVADLLFLGAFTAWERTDWGKLVVLCNNVTALQPRVIKYWEMSVCYMAYDASVAARNNPRLPREALRIKAERQYWDLGRDFVERGIRNNPDRWKLYERLAILMKDKYQNHAAASEAFTKVSRFKDAPEYAKRFAAYELSYCEGREAEAYALLLRYFNQGPQERLPTLIARLKALEEKLSIPPEQRIYIPARNHH
ncbi:MAG: hypothetical protein WCP06_00375 [Verrucomicrobiota bacterium]